MPHEHRHPTPADFEGKTIAKFEGNCLNIWKFWFTDGTSFAIQAETIEPYDIAGMELCEVLRRNRTINSQLGK